MKKFLACISVFCLMAAPVSLTSCNDDDVQTVLGILDYFLNTNDLAGTAWLATDNSMAIEFSDARNGAMVVADQNTQSGNRTFQFTYTLNENVLTLSIAEAGTMTFTITGFEKQKTLVLTDSKNNSVTFNYYTGQ